MTSSKGKHGEPQDAGGSIATSMAGDVFRIVGLPDNFIIGLDTMAMTTSRSLPGFRGIPPGPHFLWVQQPDGVSRCGYWFVTGTRQLVRVKEWDRYNESLGVPATRADTANQVDSLESTFSNLKPYTLHDHRDKSELPLDGALPHWARSPASLWNVLTSAISKQTLVRISEQEGVDEFVVDSMDYIKDARPKQHPPANKSQPDGSGSNELSFLFTQDFRDLQVLDPRVSRARATDTSARVEAVLTSIDDKRITEQEIIAELQFTFLTGTHLGNAACLEQWWNLVLKIALRAYKLVVTRPQLTATLIRTLHSQLLYTEHYFGSSASETENTGKRGAGTGDGPSSERPIFQYKPQYREKLRQSLVEYKRQAGDLLLALGAAITTEQRAVGEAFEELEAWLWRWKWDLKTEAPSEGAKYKHHVPDSDEEEDEQPVVVELDEEGREVGLVSFRD